MSPVQTVLQHLICGPPQGHPRSSSLPSEPLVHIDLNDSDDVLFTPTTERVYQMQQSQLKRATTLRDIRTKEKATKEGMKKALLDNFLEGLELQGLSIPEFLDYVYDPATVHTTFDWQWHGFFQDKVTMERVFNRFMTKQFSASARTWIKDWATKQVTKVVTEEALEITESGLLRKSNKVINKDFFLSYSLRDITKSLRSLAPSTFTILDSFSTTTCQVKSLTSKWRERKEMMQGAAVLSLLKSRSQNNSYAQAVHSTYLMATGAQRQHFGVLSAMGISMGYTSIINQHAFAKATPLNNAVAALEGGASENPAEMKKKKMQTLGTLYQLLKACMATAWGVASTGFFVVVYDNINMMVQIAEQVLGRKNAQENGTCTTAVPLYNVALEDLSAEKHAECLKNADPLSLKHLEFTDTEAGLYHAATHHTMLRIIVLFGGPAFTERWQKDLDKCRPCSEEVIEVHQTRLHPLPSMEIDENSTQGNVEVVEAVTEALGLDFKSQEYNVTVKILAGDQLTIARQRSIMNL
ncbi:hypothetical protein DXG01_004465 [Tephrocybe rancida]|nr:hypothetical protein DXG01_004465 [Tephrocybe rancida]